MTEVNAVKPTNVVVDVEAVVPNVNMVSPQQEEPPVMALKMESDVYNETKLQHSMMDAKLYIYTTKELKDTEIKFARYSGRLRRSKVTSKTLPKDIGFVKRKRGWLFWNNTQSGDVYNKRGDFSMFLGEVEELSYHSPRVKNPYNYRYPVYMKTEWPGGAETTPLTARRLVMYFSMGKGYLSSTNHKRVQRAAIYTNSTFLEFMYGFSQTKSPHISIK